MQVYAVKRGNGKKDLSTIEIAKSVNDLKESFEWGGYKLISASKLNRDILLHSTKGLIPICTTRKWELEQGPDVIFKLE